MAPPAVAWRGFLTRILVSDCSVGKFALQVGKKGSQVGKIALQVGSRYSGFSSEGVTNRLLLLAVPKAVICSLIVMFCRENFLNGPTRCRLAGIFLESDCSVGKFELQVRKMGSQVGKFDGQVGKIAIQVGIAIFWML